MEEKDIFTYKYSAAQNREVERIRKKYLPKEKTELELLRELDRRVQSAGVVSSLCIGIIGCLIFGTGLCFGLDVFAGGSMIAALLSALGILIMLPAYPIYRRISKRTKDALTPEILRLSEEIMKNQADN